MKVKITPILITAVLAGIVAWKLVENKRTIDRNTELFSTGSTVIPNHRRCAGKIPQSG